MGSDLRLVSISSRISQILITPLTCNRADCMSKNWEATQEVNVDDWLYFDGMGGKYTSHDLSSR